MIVSPLLHLATTSGSAILGGVMRFLSDNAKDRAARDKQHHDTQLAFLNANTKAQVTARKDANRPISKTRRFVVIAIVSAVITLMFVGGLTGVDVNVPIVSNAQSFFGFSWGGNTSYEALSGFVLIPEILLALNAIISMLFGSTITSRS